MLQWLKNIKRTDWLIIGLYYTFALPISYVSTLLEHKISLFSSEAGFILWLQVTDFSFDVLATLILVFVIFSRFFFQQKYILTLVWAVVLFIVQALIQPLLFPSMYSPIQSDIALRILGGIENNVESITPVCLLLIAKQFYESKSQLMELQKEKKETELRWLKAQIDPHFLFNNLNILDILISTNPAKASIYTKRLSSLYRYMIRHKDQDVVSLLEEWKFSQDYIYLLQQRFDDLFIFEDNLSTHKLEHYFIPPAAMQTLLENIVKHNVALPGQPITANIYLQDNLLCVENDLRKKEQVQHSTGTGLENLRKRIELLTDQTVIMEQTDDEFLVKVPLVQEIR